MQVEDCLETALGSLNAACFIQGGGGGRGQGHSHKFLLMIASCETDEVITHTASNTTVSHTAGHRLVEEVYHWLGNGACKSSYSFLAYQSSCAIHDQIKHVPDNSRTNSVPIETSETMPQRLRSPGQTRRPTDHLSAKNQPEALA